MKSFMEIILTGLLALFLSSWAFNASCKENENYLDIKGKIIKINRAGKEALRIGRLGTLVVDGSKPDGTEYKASVLVTGKTLIFKEINQVRQKAGFEDLKEGLQVTVKFIGPILMSYPVQAVAGEVRIIFSSLALSEILLATKTSLFPKSHIKPL